MDVWQYILQENIPLPSIYFSHQREMFMRDGASRRRFAFHAALKPEEKVKEMRVASAPSAT